MFFVESYPIQACYMIFDGTLMGR